MTSLTALVVHGAYFLNCQIISFLHATSTYNANSPPHLTDFVVRSKQSNLTISIILRFYFPTVYSISHVRPLGKVSPREYRGLGRCCPPSLPRVQAVPRVSFTVVCGKNSCLTSTVYHTQTDKNGPEFPGNEIIPVPVP